MTEQREFIDVLVEKELLTSEQANVVQKQSQETGESIEEVITRQRLIFPESFAQAKAEYVGLPYVDLSQVEINEEAMEGISRKAANTYRFAAFGIKDGYLLVAMEEPDNYQALEAIKFIAKRKGLQPKIYLASEKSINETLGNAAVVKEEIGTAVKEFSHDLEEAKGVQGKKSGDIERIMEEAPVTKVVAVIIRHAVEGAASDIHIEPTEKDLRVRYRIDGLLHTTLVLPSKIQPAVISRIKILANLKIDESRLPQDGRFSATIDDRAYDYRVSIMPTTFGEKAVLRILDKSAGAPSFDNLGLQGDIQEIYKKNMQAPHGIILISGPTGSGKSTTLFTTLTELNSPDVNIITLEDPVEYEVEGVNQTQVHASIGLTFASGLRSVLRQDPDIIMVGEIRDRETAELSVHAALTGHLVFSTIHTNSAIDTIPRLIDMGIDAFLLSASLRLVVAQRLVSRLCQACKQEVPMPESLKNQVVQELSDVLDKHKVEENHRNPTYMYQSAGCPECGDVGLSGRIAIFEAAPVSRLIREGINSNPDFDELHAKAKQEGMISMREDGLLKALSGKVRIEDVLSATAESEGEEVV